VGAVVGETVGTVGAAVGELLSVGESVWVGERDGCLVVGANVGGVGDIEGC
jgi:hypothetical protein